MGRRVAQWRVRRNMTQQQFADRLGKSKSWVDKVERGVRRLERVSNLREVAATLRIDLGALLAERPGRPMPLPPGWRGCVRPWRGTTSRPRPARSTSRSSGAASTTRSRLPARPLPGTARPAARSARRRPRGARHPPRPGGRRAAGDGVRLVALALLKVDQGELAWLAADRGMAVAASTNDPTVLAVATVPLAQALRAGGRRQSALQAAVVAADQITPARPGSVPADPALLGTLLVQAALAAAGRGDGRVQELFDRAARLAEETGEGSAAVEAARLVAEAGLGTVTAATVRHERLTAGDGWRWLPPEHRAAYLVDAARAYARAGDTLRAGRALLDAERIARGEVHDRPAVRDLVAVVARSAPPRRGWPASPPPCASPDARPVDWAARVVRAAFIQRSRHVMRAPHERASSTTQSSSGQRAAGSGQRAAGSGQRAAGSGQLRLRLCASVVLVAAGEPFGIEPGRRDEFGVAVAAEPDGPVAVVEVAVMVAAEQHGVGQARVAAVGPVPDVVGVAPAGRAVAAREGAAAVAQDQGASQRAGDEPALPADVEWLAGAAEDGGQDRRVAGEPAHRLGGELQTGVESAGAELPGQRVVACGDDDLGGVAAVLGQLAGAQGEPADVGERVVPALPGQRGFVRPGRCGQRVDRGAQQAGGLGVEDAGQPQPAVGQLGRVTWRSRLARRPRPPAPPGRRRRRPPGRRGRGCGCPACAAGSASNCPAHSTRTPTAFPAASAPAAVCTVLTVSPMTRACSTLISPPASASRTPGAAGVQRSGEIDQPAGGGDAEPQPVAQPHRRRGCALRGRGASTVQLPHEGQLDRGQALLEAVRGVERRDEVVLAEGPGRCVEAVGDRGLRLRQLLQHGTRE